MVTPPEVMGLLSTLVMLGLALALLHRHEQHRPSVKRAPVRVNRDEELFP